MLSHEVTRSARAALFKRARSLRRLEFGQPVENTFRAAQIRNGAAAKEVVSWLEEVFGDQVGRPALYSLSADGMGTAKKITDEFKAHRKKKDLSHRLPSFNGDAHAGPTLYVGSSENIRRRLVEHLGEAATGTYAMNMRRWCPEFEGTVLVNVQLLSPDTSRESRQDIEDALWGALHPIFGKKGPR